MRVDRAALFSLVVLALPVLPLNAEPCGCAAPRAPAPCQAETLETVTAPHASVFFYEQQHASLELSHCWDCGGTDLLGGFVTALLLLPFIVAVRRVLARRARLLIPRFDLLSHGTLSTIVEVDVRRPVHCLAPVPAFR